MGINCRHQMRLMNEPVCAMEGEKDGEIYIHVMKRNPEVAHRRVGHEAIGAPSLPFPWRWHQSRAISRPRVSSVSRGPVRPRRFVLKTRFDEMVPGRHPGIESTSTRQDDKLQHA